MTRINSEHQDILEAKAKYYTLLAAGKEVEVRAKMRNGAYNEWAGWTKAPCAIAWMPDFIYDVREKAAVPMQMQFKLGPKSDLKHCAGYVYSVERSYGTRYYMLQAAPGKTGINGVQQKMLMASLDAPGCRMGLRVLEVENYRQITDLNITYLLEDAEWQFVGRLEGVQMVPQG